jgi:predicted TPR repeat methyltransferase
MNRMPPVPETSAGPAYPGVANDYDSFAEAYSAETEANLINGYYARPAMLALAGDVAGRRILDAGCGSGPLFGALRDRGAIVTGFDSSTKMVELARRRTDEWTMGGQTARMSFWHRPLHAMTDAFTAAGFRIAVISEPAPAPAARDLFPGQIAAKPRFLCFLFFVLQAPAEIGMLPGGP